MNKENAAKAYAILVEYAGAPNDDWSLASFIYHQTGVNYPREYRFQGKLGFGGKFWRNRNNFPSVNCYLEDETPERLLAMELANDKLALLFFNLPTEEW